MRAYCHTMKRLFDITLSLVGLILASPVFILCILAIKLTSRGPVFHMSKRVGRGNAIFRMFKFRTMKIDTPQLATHLMKEPGKYLTPAGRFLRTTSLDELPQLLNVLKGDMSMVGPRPALFNQDDLVALRTKCGVHELLPGITGWAQTHGRDEIPIPLKVQRDVYYLENRSVLLDLKILWLTAANVLRGTNVSH